MFDIGNFTEQITRGAFRKTLRENSPVLQFDHGRHPMLGSVPLGSIEKVSEDTTGLHVKARLHDNWLVQPVRDSIANGSVSGMSFRFEPVQDKWNAAKTHRTLLEVRVPEFGPVVMPAYTDTSVSVRAKQALTDLGDPEVRRDVAYWAMRDAEEALADEAAERGTSDDEPPADQEPASEATSASSTRREQLDALARLKGIIE